MGAKPDVLVIGGGIIGLTSAYFLARAGLTVEVIDRGELGQEASWAGAGIIPPAGRREPAAAIDRLRSRGARAFPKLSAELRDETGIDNGFVRCGGVEFIPADELSLVAPWAEERIRFELLPAGRLADCEPAVTEIPNAVPVLLPDLGQVRNPWHLRALIAACFAVGVQLRPGIGFSGWQFDAGRVVGIHTSDGGTRHAGHYTIASGAWAVPVLEPLGCRPPVRPVRGQIVLFRCPRPPFSRVLAVDKRYLVPRPDGRVLVGSTEEPEAGFEKANTPEGVAGLMRFARDLVPALGDAPVEKAWSGLRPGSPDGMPFIGPVPGYDSVIAAVGHFRAGVQLSIGTAEIVRALVTGRPPPLPVDAFRLDREPAVGVRPAFRS